MAVIYIMLPLAIVMASAGLAAFFWAVHRGQFDDLDTPRYRALFDECDEKPVEPVVGPPDDRERPNSA